MNPKGQKERKDGKKGVTKYRKMERRGEVLGRPHTPTLPTALQCEGQK